MKIAHVVDSLDVGGAEKMVALLSRAHQELGHRVSIHCLYTRGSLAEELETAGVTVRVVEARSPLAKVLMLWRQFARLGPDVVHCHNIAATLIGAPAARALMKPVVVATRHGLAESAPKRTSSERKFELAARCCDHVIAVSEAAFRNLSLAGNAVRCRLELVRNCSTTSSRSSHVKTLRKSTGPSIVICVARLVAEKDHDTLLRAIAIAHKRVPLKLWIVGDGPLRPQLEALADDLGLGPVVEFLGERSDVGDLMSRADMFALTSVTEGLPLALLEAMSASLPAIVTDVGGMPEVVGLSKAGFISPPGNAPQFAAAVQRLAAEDMIGLGMLARTCYLKHFQPDSLTAAYLRLYGERNHVRLPGGSAFAN